MSSDKFSRTDKGVWVGRRQSPSKQKEHPAVSWDWMLVGEPRGRWGPGGGSDSFLARLMGLAFLLKAGEPWSGRDRV